MIGVFSKPGLFRPRKGLGSGKAEDKEQCNSEIGLPLCGLYMVSVVSNVVKFSRTVRSESKFNTPLVENTSLKGTKREGYRPAPFIKAYSWWNDR